MSDPTQRPDPAQDQLPDEGALVYYLERDLGQAHTDLEIDIFQAVKVKVLESRAQANPTLKVEDVDNPETDALAGWEHADPSGIDRLYLNNDADQDRILLACAFHLDVEMDMAGSGGGAVTQGTIPWRVESKDGDLTTIGSKSDAAETDSTKDGTVVAFLKGLVNLLNNPLDVSAADVPVISGASALDVEDKAYSTYDGGTDSISSEAALNGGTSKDAESVRVQVSNDASVRGEITDGNGTVIHEIPVGAFRTIPVDDVSKISMKSKDGTTSITVRWEVLS